MTLRAGANLYQVCPLAREMTPLMLDRVKPRCLSPPDWCAPLWRRQTQPSPMDACLTAWRHPAGYKWRQLPEGGQTWYKFDLTCVFHTPLYRRNGDIAIIVFIGKLAQPLTSFMDRDWLDLIDKTELHFATTQSSLSYKVTPWLTLLFVWLLHRTLGNAVCPKEIMGMYFIAD